MPPHSRTPKYLGTNTDNSFQSRRGNAELNPNLHLLFLFFYSSEISQGFNWENGGAPAACLRPTFGWRARRPCCNPCPTAANTVDPLYAQRCLLYPFRLLLPIATSPPCRPLHFDEQNAQDRPNRANLARLLPPLHRRGGHW